MYKGQEFQGRIERSSEVEPKKDDYLLYKWDFTKSLVDEVNNVPLFATRGNNIAISDKGIQFTNKSDFIMIDLGSNVDLFNKTIEVEWGDFDLGPSSSLNHDMIATPLKSKYDSSTNSISGGFAGCPLYFYGQSMFNLWTKTSKNPTSTSGGAVKLRWAVSDNYSTMRNYLQNKSYRFYCDRNTGSYFGAVDDLLVHCCNWNYPTGISKVSSSYPPFVSLDYNNVSETTVTWAVLENAYLVIGDARAASSTNDGVKDCSLKEIRIYDGMFIDISPLSYYEPVQS